MRKILLILVLLMATGCGQSIERNDTVEVDNSDGDVFKEENDEGSKEIVELPEKKEEVVEENKSLENPEPNPKPEETPKKEPPEIVKITIEDNEESSEKPEKPIQQDGFIKNPNYEIADPDNEKENYMDIYYFGTTIDDAKLRNYNMNTTIINEDGESLLFVPQVYGGSFKINYIEYDPDKGGFWMKDTIVNGIELQQDDAVLLKMVLPETSPNIIITYEKKGEFLIQTIPVYEGLTGDIRSDKGFKIINQ
ncbi:MAG: hypothetical protein Q4P34_03845 [Tissierellia bacterium]|nr:hypothetical protein [Tissierellia bacterium]